MFGSDEPEAVKVAKQVEAELNDPIMRAGAAKVVLALQEADL